MALATRELDSNTSRSPLSIMGLKRHTIIFVPHGSAKFRKLQISSRQLAGLVAVALILTSAASLASWHYLSRFGTAAQVGDLQRENDELRATNLSFEESARKLQQELARYEDRTEELAIIAGIEKATAPPEDQAAAAGVGGAGDPGDFLPDLPSMAERSAKLRRQLELVDEGLEERRVWLSARPSSRPVKGVFTSGYGYREDPITGVHAFHRGIDLSAPAGNEVRATADGVVARAGKVGGFGRSVLVAHGFGYSTRYAHLSQIEVEPGQKVRRGDVLGSVGRSGRATGYHVHYEVHEDGRSRNPLEFILDGASQ